MGSTDVFALAIHADYRCRHSGVCCSLDWDVPIELPVYRSLQEAVAAGTLTPYARDREPFVEDPELPEEAAAIFQRTEQGACVFFEPASKLCIVHRDRGADALAATCRNFPRVAVRDQRGTFVSLSHFCPTAASLLFREDRPLEIVADPPAFPPADYDGLAVTDEDLPPLLTPTMLMDLEGYSAWERHMVRRCADASASPESVLATLARDAALLRQWRPGASTLVEAVERLPREPVVADAPSALGESLALHAGVMGAVPDEMKPDPDEQGLEEAFDRFVRQAWDGFRQPLNRYLGAKAFASWTAYQGKGVATIVRGLEAAMALVRVEAARQCRDSRRALDESLLKEAIRQADFALNHLAIGEDLASSWSIVEGSPQLFKVAEGVPIRDR